MSVFFALVGISVAGVLFVFFLLQREKQNAGVALQDFGSKPSLPLPLPDVSKKPGLFGGFVFARLIPGKKIPQNRELRQETSLPSLKHFLEEQNRQNPSVRTAVAAAGPAGGGSKSSSVSGPQLTAAEEKRIEQEIDFAARLEEWKEKCERLDKLLQEKSAAFVKNEELLAVEVNNRKEVNKLKDMLEKELKDAREKARVIQVELNASRVEAESYKKRVNQLEEKITKMEKALLAKDDDIAGLVKRLEIKPAPAPTLEKSDSPAVNQDEQKGGGETNG